MKKTLLALAVAAGTMFAQATPSTTPADTNPPATGKAKKAKKVRKQKHNKKHAQTSNSAVPQQK